MTPSVLDGSSCVEDSGSLVDKLKVMQMTSMRNRLKRCLLPRWLAVQQLPIAAGASVLLTFDDGPHPRATPAILDRLSKFGARAIFFVVGSRIHRTPDMLRRISAEGHSLGNHTHTHPLDRRMNYTEYVDDLRRCQGEVFLQSGTTPRFHRPPLGTLSMASLPAPKRLGLTTLIWSRS